MCKQWIPGQGTRLGQPSLGTRPSKNRKGGSGESAGVEVHVHCAWYAGALPIGF